MIPTAISCRLSNHKWPWPPMCSLSMASLRSLGSRQPPPSVAGWGQLGKPSPRCVTAPVFLTERSVLCVELYLNSVCETTPLLRSFSQALAFLWFYRKFTGNLAEIFFTFFFAGGEAPFLYIGTSYIAAKCWVNQKWLKRGSISCEQFVLAQ